MNIKISLAAARVNAGLTQEEVAKRMHVGKATIVSWEKGESEPRISQALMLSDIYNMPIEHIFFERGTTLSGSEEGEKVNE